LASSRVDSHWPIALTKICDFLVRKERSEKKPEKEHPNRLFKSPCHHHEGKALRENKV
jgi:hypothetical protein